MPGLYVHVPFCVRKCLYCDFYSLPQRGNERKAFVRTVLAEAQPYAGMSFQSLYLGGGTPSLLGEECFAHLLTGLRNTFDMSGLEEATVEVNPDSATTGFLKTARSCGINRISIGVQSLDDAELRAAGRVHTAAQAADTIVSALKTGFDSVSADLIAGLPGQSWSSLRRSLENVTRSGVHHLSLYCLSLEDGTPMAANPPANLPGEDEQADLFENAVCFLVETGFVHYEISNFARPGHQCRHNLNYWRGSEYLGLGPAAASHLEGKRFRNRRDLSDYLKTAGGVKEEVEALDQQTKAAEEAMLRLRLLTEGLDIDEMTNRFGPANVAPLLNRLRNMAGDGKLVAKGSKFRLPNSRVLTSNSIFAEVLV